jgi:MOSC domain-containing protein YiiM/predicted GNAT family acetyltransferase
MSEHRADRADLVDRADPANLADRTDRAEASIPASARVVQVNVSPGGVPKLPVAEARVGRFGLDGDGHREPTVHGGPHRAVALFAIEAIRRVAADGHPIHPGSCGENLTTEGVELSTLSIGTRLAVGPDVVLELSAPDNPCRTIRGSFSDERFGRISILAHPTDSRMYARVIAEGIVRPGDPVRVLPPAAGSRASELDLLARLDAAHRKSSLARWQAAADAGVPLRIVDDGELAMAALPGSEGPLFNRAHGFEGLPNLLDRALDFFAAVPADGWVDLEPDALDGLEAVQSVEQMSIHAVEPERVLAAERAAVPGLTIRAAGTDEGRAWAQVHIGAGGLPDDLAEAWLRSSEPLARAAHSTLLLAELDGRPVGAGALYVHREVGWLRATTVVPEARGRGIQRALIAARAEAATEAGCTLVGSAASLGSTSEANLRAMGLVHLATRGSYLVSSLAGLRSVAGG